MIRPGKFNSLLLPALAVLALASSAEAHTGHGVHGFVHGALHPITGLDHLLAMLAVGVWATRSDANPKRWWLLPAVFVACLVVGLMLGVASVPLPGVEFGIKGSVVVLGVLVAGGWKLPMTYAIGITALFAICHGHAHGAEMPTDTSGLTYGLGMVLATAALHAMGVGIGFLASKDSMLPMLRIGGGAMAAVGVLLMTGVM